MACRSYGRRFKNRAAGLVGAAARAGAGRLVSADELAALAEIEGATSQRLVASGAEPRVTPRRIRSRRALRQFHQRGLRLFEAPRAQPFQRHARGLVRGARSRDLHARGRLSHGRIPGEVGGQKGVVEYAEMFASMAGEFVDLGCASGHPCLDPDPADGYPIGNAIADAARAQGLNGVIYPSVRRAGEPASSR